MAPMPSEYYKNVTESDTSATVILDVSDDEFRVTEKRDGSWCVPFWMPEDQFDELVEATSEVAGELSEEDLDCVINLATQ